MFFVILIICITQVLMVQYEYEAYNLLLIKRNNIQELQKINQQLYILFHKPSCQFSRRYKERFSLIAERLKQNDSALVIGTVDCEKQGELCQTYRINSFPSLVLSKNQTNFSLLNEEQFIHNLGIINLAQNEEYQTGKIAEYLETQPNYFVAILEELGIPIQERLKKQRVFYLQPSRLYDTLLNFSNSRVGCWIFRYNNNFSYLQKYSCGTGIHAQNVDIAIKMFLKGQLKEYIVQKEFEQKSQLTNEIVLNYDELLNIYQNKTNENKVVLYYADWCPFYYHITNTISNVVKELKKAKVIFYSYKIDHNQIPKDKYILSIPYLEVWKKGEVTLFNGRYVAANLITFMNKIYFPSQQQRKNKVSQTQL